MNKLKTGIILIILGNILYLSYIFFTGNETSSFGEFTEGLLLGLSVGTNLLLYNYPYKLTISGKVVKIPQLYWGIFTTFE